MDVTAMLTEDAPVCGRRSSFASPPAFETTPPHASGSAMTPTSLSPHSEFKTVNISLRCSTSDTHRFRVHPHDNVDSITDAARNVFGIPREHNVGTSFEDEDGYKFVPNYSNFCDGMTVYLCVKQPPMVSKHAYSLRQTPIANGVANLAYAGRRSISPPAGRGRRSASASATGRGRSLKRQAQDTGDGYYHDMSWREFPQLRQHHLPGEDDEGQRQSMPGALSADISTDNIVMDGGRRKRPRFSADELPLYTVPTLPALGGSPLSISPSHPPAQVSTPYRHHSFAQPTPSSYAGSLAGYPTNGHQIRHSIAVPTPAPTVASCISDEDVAMQLMRLQNADNSTRTNSTLDECQEQERGFTSEAGEYGDDGRSDTTELPDPVPANNHNQVSRLRDSPILYPRARKTYKHLDEILPSEAYSSSTEASDDENQPPVHNRYVHMSHSHLVHQPRRANGLVTDDEDEGYDDEADGSYVAPKEESEDDGDYDDDLDETPLMIRRDSQKTSATHIHNVLPKPHTNGTKGATKATKRPTVLKSKAMPPLKTDEAQHHYPISPASPPASRKPSVASSSGTKARPNGAIPMPLYLQDYHQGVTVGHPGSEHAIIDEANLKPRCQRCRKSKKGCDRQRPCQRCKDAGIPAEGCISEDEAGTRRGRQAAAAAKRAGLVNGMAKLKSKPKKKKVV